MLRFQHIEGQKGLFTFYREQDSLNQTKAFNNDVWHPLEPTQKHQREKHRRKQSQQSMSLQGGGSNVDTFLANCLVRKRKAALPVVEQASVENRYTNQQIRDDRKTKQSESNEGSYEKIISKPKAKKRTKKAANLPSVIYKQVLLTDFNKSITQECSITHQQTSIQDPTPAPQPPVNVLKKMKNQKKASPITKMLKVQDQQSNIEREEDKQNNHTIINMKKQNIVELKFEGVKSKSKKKMHKKSKNYGSLSENRFKDYRIKIPNSQIIEQLKDYERGTPDQRKSQAASPSERSFHIKLPSIPNSSPQAANKIKRKPNILTDKSSDKFPECLLKRFRMEHCPFQGQLKKVQQGNSVMMLDHIRDDIIDGWQKRKIQFLQKLCVKNLSLKNKY